VASTPTSYLTDLEGDNAPSTVNVTIPGCETVNDDDSMQLCRYIDFRKLMASAIVGVSESQNPPTISSLSDLGDNSLLIGKVERGAENRCMRKALFWNMIKIQGGRFCSVDNPFDIGLWFSCVGFIIGGLLVCGSFLCYNHNHMNFMQDHRRIYSPERGETISLREYHEHQVSSGETPDQADYHSIDGVDINKS